MRNCSDEVVKGCIDTIKEFAIMLAYNEGTNENFKTLVALDEILKILEDQVAGIEEEKDRQKKMASNLRKQFGEAFSAECDAAGIK